MITGAACGSPCGGKGTWYKYTYYERTAKIVYGCPNGGTLNGTKCVVAGSSYSATASTSYSCPNGGTRDGSKCTLTASPSTQTVYSCPSGYTKNGSKCTKTYAATANTGAGSYSCPNGGTLNGSKCTITRDADKVVGDTTYTCPSGYTYNKSNKKIYSAYSNEIKVDNSAPVAPILTNAAGGADEIGLVVELTIGLEGEYSYGSHPHLDGIEIYEKNGNT